MRNRLLIVSVLSIVIASFDDASGMDSIQESVSENPKGTRSTKEPQNDEKKASKTKDELLQEAKKSIETAEELLKNSEIDTILADNIKKNIDSIKCKIRQKKESIGDGKGVNKAIQKLIKKLGDTIKKLQKDKKYKQKNNERIADIVKGLSSQKSSDGAKKTKIYRKPKAENEAEKKIDVKADAENDNENEAEKKSDAPAGKNLKKISKKTNIESNICLTNWLSYVPLSKFIVATGVIISGVAVMIKFAIESHFNLATTITTIWNNATLSNTSSNKTTKVALDKLFSPLSWLSCKDTNKSSIASPLWPAVIPENNEVSAIGSAAFCEVASKVISNLDKPQLLLNTVSNPPSPLWPAVIPENNEVSAIGSAAFCDTASEFLKPQLPQSQLWPQLLRLPSSVKPVSPSDYSLKYNLPTVRTPVGPSIVNSDVFSPINEQRKISISGNICALVLISSPIWMPLLMIYTPKLVSMMYSVQKKIASISVGRWFASTSVVKRTASFCNSAKEKIASFYNLTNKAYNSVLDGLASTSVVKYYISAKEKINFSPIYSLVWK